MSVRIRKGSSRLVHSDLVVIDDIEFWTRPSVPDIDDAASDRFHLVEDTDRIDTISKRNYKRDDWWWVLAHRNNLRLLPNDIKTGDSIVIPLASLIRKNLF